MSIAGKWHVWESVLDGTPTPEDSQRLLKEVEEEVEPSPFCLYLKGRALFMLQKDSDALLALQEAMNGDDTLHQAFYYGGITSRYLNKGKEAVALLRKAATMTNDTETPASKRSFYWRALANALMSEKVINEAEEAYRKSIEAELSFGGLSALGACLLQQNKEKEGSDMLQSALDQVTGKYSAAHTTCLFNLGSIRFKQKNFADAVNHFVNVVELEPKDFGAVCKVIQCYTTLGDAEKCEEYVIKARELRKAKLAPARFCREQVFTEHGTLLCYEYFEFSAEFKAPFYLVFWEKDTPASLPSHTLMGSYDTTNDMDAEIKGGHPDGCRLWHWDSYFANGSHQTLLMRCSTRPTYEEAKSVLINGIQGNAKVVSSFSPATK